MASADVDETLCQDPAGEPIYFSPPMPAKDYESSPAGTVTFAGATLKGDLTAIPRWYPARRELSGSEEEGRKTIAYLADGPYGPAP